MADLIVPHGGVAEPVNRAVANLDGAEFHADPGVRRRPVHPLPHRRRRPVPAHRAHGQKRIRPGARRRSHRPQRQEVRLDHPACLSGQRGAGQEIDHGDRLSLAQRERPTGRCPDGEGRVFLGQDEVHHSGVCDTARRSSRRPHRQDRSANLSRRRRRARLAPAEAPGLWPLHPVAPRNAGAVRQEGLAAGRRLPDAQPAAPRPRIRPGRRPRTPDARGPSSPGPCSTRWSARPRATTSTPPRACRPTGP